MLSHSRDESLEQPMTEIRPPAVAGAFYSGAREALMQDLTTLLEAAPAISPDTAVPKALIAPHAGYIYSGPTAAHAYARLAPARGRIKRVVLLGPAHRVAVDGLVLPGVHGLQTPLGVVPVDREAVRLISSLPQIGESKAAHAHEHSLEVHLPFLQAMLGMFALVPLVVGRASTEQVAQVLDRLWGGEETLIVISSDLSHYLGYEQAQETDRETARTILMRRPQLNHHQACGATPVNGLLDVAQRRGLKPELFDLRNSGDTAGDHSRVVGYASVGFFEPVARTGEVDSDLAQPDTRGEVLVPLARSAIGGIFGVASPVDERAAFLQEIGATFVTLTRHGKLRGCIGSLQPHRSLLEDVKANAKAAAFLDPRFQPLTQTEFATTLVEVSVLSPSEPLEFGSEQEALERIRPGIDGLIFEHGSRRGTFLPQVWESIPEPAEFLRQLKRKAGLEPDFWADEVRLRRYTVVKFGEDELPSLFQ
jgi:AmmeMemoRadiSam system protein B/AmmeMemoRadiSam system protein A